MDQGEVGRVHKMGPVVLAGGGVGLDNPKRSRRIIGHQPLEIHR